MQARYCREVGITKSHYGKHDRTFGFRDLPSLKNFPVMLLGIYPEPRDTRSLDRTEVYQMSPKGTFTERLINVLSMPCFSQYSCKPAEVIMPHFMHACLRVCIHFS